MYKQVRHHSVKLISFLDAAIGTLLCTSAAALLAALFASSSVRVALPLICLAIVLAVAARFGATAGGGAHCTPTASEARRAEKNAAALTGANSGKGRGP